MNNLQKRILTSIIILPISIFFILKGGNYIVSPICDFDFR